MIFPREKPFVELYVRNTRFMRGLQQARQRLASFGSEITALGRQMAMMSGAMLLPIAMGAKTFADFDDSMRQVKAVTGSTETEFLRLTETAKLLGRTTSFTAIEVGLLMAELGRAGFAADQIDVMTSSVLNLARATGTEAPQAAGIMAASIRQFGLAAGDAGRVADGLTAAANKSFNTVEQLGEALSYAGPVASDFNMTLEDTLAILGGLGNVGIQGSAAGTAVRRLLTLTGAEAKKLNKIFGVSFMDAAGNARPLVDVLDEVNKATENLGTAERAAKFNEAFGLLGITGASAIGRSAGSIRDLQQAIAEAGGTAEETAKEMDAGLGGAFRIMRSAIEGARIALGEAVEGGLTRVVEAGTQVLGVLTKLIKENKAAVVSFAKVGAAVGVAGAALIGVGLSLQFASVVLGGFATLIGVVTFAISSMVGVIGFLFSPLGLLTAALVGAGVAFFKFSDAGQSALASLRERASSILGSLSKTFRDTFSGIMDAIKAGDLGLAGQIAMTSLRLVFAQGMAKISEMIGGTMGDALGTLTKLILSGDFAGAWNVIVLGMSAVWASFTEGMVTAMADAAKDAIALWKGAVDTIVNYILEQSSKSKALSDVFQVTGSLATGGASEAVGPSIKTEVDRNTELEDQRQSGMRRILDNEIEDAKAQLNIAIDAGDHEAVERLKEELAILGDNLRDLDEIGTPDIFDQIEAGTYSDPATQAIADRLMGRLDAMREDAKARADEARGAFRESISGGAFEASDEVKRIQKELDELRKQARDGLDAASREGGSFGVLKSDGAPGAFGGGSDSGSGKASAATFSGFGALAMGMGGGGVEREVKEVKKAIEKVAADQIDWLKQVNTNIKNQSLHHP